MATGSLATIPPGAGRRRLGGAAGSLGVSFTVQVDLGKTPPVAAAQAYVAVLQAPLPPTFFNGILANISAASNVPLSQLSATAGTATLVDSQINGLASASAASSASTASSTGAGVGAAIGVALLVLIFWSWRSWSKHGVLPCFRNRSQEAHDMKVKAAAAAEKRLEEELTTVNPVLVNSSQGLTLRVPKVVADELAELRALKCSLETAKPKAAAMPVDVEEAVVKPSSKTAKKNSFPSSQVG